MRLPQTRVKSVIKSSGVPLFILLWFGAVGGAPLLGQVSVTVRNPIAVARRAETISLKAAELKSLLPFDDLRRVHVRDSRTGTGLLTQAADDDGDGKYDVLLFQTDLAPNETRSFELSVGERVVRSPQGFKAYGRFVREREDDFAWENDRIAHRMYGEALETWPQEPLTSSAVDVWVKKTPRLVINDWYLVDDYHRDHGEGGDFYAAGDSRGCGGNGIWVNGQLYPSANFRSSRVIANGPIRVIFELTYAAWDVGGARVSEVKRITLDAGQNFDHFESRYTITGNGTGMEDAIGIRKGTGPQIAKSPETGVLRSWETLPDHHGRLGIAVIVAPASLDSFSEDSKNFLAIVKLGTANVVSYDAGFGWSESGFPTEADWEHYVSEYAQRVKSPVQVTLSGR